MSDERDTGQDLKGSIAEKQTQVIAPISEQRTVDMSGQAAQLAAERILRSDISDQPTIQGMTDAFVRIGTGQIEHALNNPGQDFYQVTDGPTIQDPPRPATAPNNEMSYTTRSIPGAENIVGSDPYLTNSQTAGGDTDKFSQAAFENAVTKADSQKDRTGRAPLPPHILREIPGPNDSTLAVDISGKTHIVNQGSGPLTENSVSIHADSDTSSIVPNPEYRGSSSVISDKDEQSPNQTLPLDVTSDRVSRETPSDASFSMPQEARTPENFSIMPMEEMRTPLQIAQADVLKAQSTFETRKGRVDQLNGLLSKAKTQAASERRPMDASRGLMPQQNTPIEAEIISLNEQLKSANRALRSAEKGLTKSTAKLEKIQPASQPQSATEGNAESHSETENSIAEGGNRGMGANISGQEQNNQANDQLRTNVLPGNTEGSDGRINGSGNTPAEQSVPTEEGEQGGVEPLQTVKFDQPSDENVDKGTSASVTEASPAIVLPKPLVEERGALGGDAGASETVTTEPLRNPVVPLVPETGRQPVAAEVQSNQEQVTNVKAAEILKQYDELPLAVQAKLKELGLTRETPQANQSESAPAKGEAEKKIAGGIVEKAMEAIKKQDWNTAGIYLMALIFLGPFGVLAAAGVMKFMSSEISKDDTASQPAEAKATTAKSVEAAAGT